MFVFFTSFYHFSLIDIFCRIEFKDWPPVKGDKERFPYGQMPTLEKDGKVYSQSIAIARYVAREHGFYPSDSEGAYFQDALTESLRDVYETLFLMKPLKTEEEKKEALEKYATTTLPANFSVWNDTISKNSSPDFITGETETMADISLVVFYANHFLSGPLGEFHLKHLEAYPELKAYLEKRYEEHKDYFDKRPDYPF